MWMFETKENEIEEFNKIRLRTYISDIEEAISSMCSDLIFEKWDKMGQLNTAL